MSVQATHTVGVTLVVLGLLLVPASTASDVYSPVPDQRLTPEDPRMGDTFGQGVAIDGNVAAILDDDGVTTWTKTEGTWSQTDRLTGTERDALDIDRPYLTVRLPDIAPKGILVYERTDDGTWTLDQNVTSPADHDANFGTSAALHGDTLAVGANRYTTDDGDRIGAVYMFERNATGGWEHTDTLTPKDEPTDTGFARKVDVHEDTVVVGARTDDTLGTNSGAAYVFENQDGKRDSWTQTAKLLAPNGEAGEFFSSGAVAVHDQLIAVPAIGQDLTAREEAGAVHTYTTNDTGIWTHEQTLLPPDGRTGDWFGFRLALTDHGLVATAAHAGHAGETGGALYVHTRIGNSFAFTEKLVDGTLNSDGFLGNGLAISNNTLLAGSPGTDVDGERNAGAAYIYHDVLDQTTQQACEGETHGEHTQQAPIGEARAGLDGNAKVCLDQRG